MVGINKFGQIKGLFHLKVGQPLALTGREVGTGQPGILAAGPAAKGNLAEQQYQHQQATGLQHGRYRDWRH